MSALHPWEDDFYINFAALGSMVGQIPATLLPAYSHLMQSGKQLSDNLQAGYLVQNSEGQNWLQEAKLFATHLPASMQGNIGATSDEGLNAGEGLQPYADSIASGAYSAAQWIEKQKADAAAAAQAAGNIGGTILLLGVIVVAAIFIVPMLERE